MRTCGSCGRKIFQENSHGFCSPQCRDEGLQLHFSPRGFLLAYQGVPSEHPVLTCELYLKWYALYLVESDGTVRQAPLGIDDLEQYAEGESVVGDHCWNPYVLQRLCDAKDWLIDYVSFDLMVGRWCNTMYGEQ